MSFWDIFTGGNKTLSNDSNNLGSIGSFATNLGTKDATAASLFNNAILSGDQQKIGQVLAPQISGIQKGAQEQKQVAGEFGDRSGGATAAMSAIDDIAHGHINDLIGELTGGAVSGDVSLGTNLLGLGKSAYNDQSNVAEEQQRNQEGGIFGSLASNVLGNFAGRATDLGLDKLFGSGAGSNS